MFFLSRLVQRRPPVPFLPLELPDALPQLVQLVGDVELHLGHFPQLVLLGLEGGFGRGHL